MTGGPDLSQPAAAWGAAPCVVVLDLGLDGLDPLVRVLERLGAQVRVSGVRSAAATAAGLVVAGTDGFAACMTELRAVHGPEVIGRRLAGGRAVLGIGGGMQVLFERWRGYGAEVAGVGEWPGTVEPLTAPALPYPRWGRVDVPAGSTLFAGVEQEQFSFTHCGAVQTWELTTTERRFRLPFVTWAEHGGERFVAAVENGPLTATQFHPEQSGNAGATLLGNWLRTLG